MPLSYGDITDHISGASLYNNGKYAWNSALNAYVFSQNGSNGDNNVAWINNVNLYPIAQTDLWIKREFDANVIIKSDNSIFTLASVSKNQYAFWPPFTAFIGMDTHSLNTWYHFEHELKIVGGTTVINTGFGNLSYRQNQSATKLFFTCGFYSSHSRYSIAIKNLKYWDLA